MVRKDVEEAGKFDHVLELWPHRMGIIKESFVQRHCLVRWSAFVAGALAECGRKEEIPKSCQCTCGGGREVGYPTDGWMNGVCHV